jgi:hypothetical protein
MTSDFEMRALQPDQAFLFAHRANIERYEKLLQTYLTEYERAFIQRRLEEERRAIAKLIDA